MCINSIKVLKVLEVLEVLKCYMTVFSVSPRPPAGSEETTVAAEESKDVAAVTNSTDKPSDRKETYFSDVKFSEMPLSDQT